MADFCKQCSIEVFGEDSGDLVGKGDGSELKPGYGWLALCEGCGQTAVDNDGTCVATKCFKKHGEVDPIHSIDEEMEEADPDVHVHDAVLEDTPRIFTHEELLEIQMCQFPSSVIVSWEKLKTFHSDSGHLDLINEYQKECPEAVCYYLSKPVSNKYLNGIRFGELGDYCSLNHITIV